MKTQHMLVSTCDPSTARGFGDNRAARFARVRHAGQCRKGAAKEPYTMHLEEVSSLVAKWDKSEEAIAAA